MGKLSSLPLTLRRHSWAALATFASVIGMSSLYLLGAAPRYEASARLLVDEKGASISELGRALTKLPENVPGGSSPIATQAELVKSQRVLKQALDRVLPANKEAVGQPNVETLSRDVKIKIIPATNILELRYQSKNAEQAAKILNAIAEATVKESSESIRREASSVRQFLETRVPQQEATLEAAEAQESRYRQASGVVAFDAQTASLVSSLSEVENQVRLLASQLQEARTKSGQLQQVIGVGSPRVAYAAARIGQDEQLKNLRVRLAEVEAKVIENSSRLGDQHPDLIGIKEQRDEIRKLYTQRVGQVLDPGQSAPPSSTEATNEVSRDLVSRYIVGEVEGNALESRLRTIQATRSGLQAQIAELPVKQQNLTALTRKREEAGATLKQLQSKLEEARIAEAQLISNVRILDVAQVPSVPAVPQPIVVLVVAIVAGAILALGVILLLETMDDKLRSVDEVEPLLQLPVLGILPKLSPNLTTESLDRFLDSPTLIEPYRMLLKTLEFRHNRKLKVILVSSTIAGEGKSDVVARLAAVASTLSLRTLVIDADLRQPLQHRLFDLMPNPGLTDVITGQTSLAEAIQPTRLGHLSILPHGDFLTRPAAMSESPEMETLIATATAKFDLVIIDTSTISSCADAVSLSRYTDGLLLVARPDFTPRETLRKAVSEIQSSSTAILGIIINNNPEALKLETNHVVGRMQPVLKPAPSLTLSQAPANAAKADINYIQ